MNRRDLFKFGAGIMAMVPFTKMAYASDSKAAACTATPAPAGVKVIDDKTTKRLKYVATSTTADQNCANCKWYKKSKKAGADNSWAKCSMAGNKYVSGCGWCKQWKAIKKK